MKKTVIAAALLVAVLLVRLKAQAYPRYEYRTVTCTTACDELTVLSLQGWQIRAVTVAESGYGWRMFMQREAR